MGKNKFLSVFVLISLIEFFMSLYVELTKNMPIDMVAEFSSIAFNPKIILGGIITCVLMVLFITRKLFL